MEFHRESDLRSVLFKTYFTQKVVETYMRKYPALHMPINFSRIESHGWIYASWMKNNKKKWLTHSNWILNNII